ncbi:MAG: hypothetical protein ACK47U_02440 [Verrucomicrobiota bacterium]|jgi:hypothetical protein
MSLFRFQSRPGSALRKLLTVLCGIALFLILVGALGVWALGRYSPRLLDASLSGQSGAHLTVEDNQTNLFVGRVDYAGLVITNPSRWQEREFLRVKRLVLDVDPLTFVEGGGQVVNEAVLDIDRVTIVGKADFLSDNNAKDIGNGLKGSPASPPPSTEPAKPAQPFLIKHLRVRVGRLTVISGDGSAARRVVVDQDFAYEFEARDVTDQNFDAKVSGPMGQQALQTALRRQPELMFELAREKLRRPSREEK